MCFPQVSTKALATSTRLKSTPKTADEQATPPLVEMGCYKLVTIDYGDVPREN